MVTFRDGQIVEAYDAWNFLDMLASLDVVPKDTMPMVMSGAKVQLVSSETLAN